LLPLQIGSKRETEEDWDGIDGEIRSPASHEEESGAKVRSKDQSLQVLD
jgi:hypothetical protein